MGIHQGRAGYTNKRKWKLHRPASSKEVLAKNARIPTQIVFGKALGQCPRLAADFLTYKTLGERRSRERWLVRYFHSEYFNIVP
jgi:hypothetical protein